MSSRKKLVVIGGGAAGFFCAVNAARMNPLLEVVIVEKTSKLLSKVKVSGGGRCNVTHSCFDIVEMSKRYPRGGNFVKKTFHQFFTTDTINWFEERGVKLKTEADGRMFPVTNSSQTIIDCLLKEVNRYGVEIMMNREVKSVNVQSSMFNIQFSSGETINADFVCIACGGYPKSSMFSWLTELGHSIEEPVPSLFTFNIPGHAITQLMGVSVENAKVKVNGTKLEQTGPLLITHWGLSGPAVLRLSAWGARGLKERNWEFGISVSWLAEREQQVREMFQEFRQTNASQKIITKNVFALPNRLWEFLATGSGITAEMRWADLPAAAQNKFIKNLCGYELQVKGKTIFKEEFVTAGGIKLNEVDANSMMSKKIPNLFFAGEIADVDGVTGGFNFQHAWTSGFIAGKNIAHLSS
ncbi:MAG TPA: NAD(P)/FAD-dependent oxidoreductase [Chitinophagaceae bacterium]